MCQQAIIIYRGEKETRGGGREERGRRQTRKEERGVDSVGDGRKYKGGRRAAGEGEGGGWGEEGYSFIECLGQGFDTKTVNRRWLPVLLINVFRPNFVLSSFCVALFRYYVRQES